MTRDQEQQEVEKLVAVLEEALTRLTNLTGPVLAEGWRTKGGKPYELVETEVARLAILEQIVLLTGDYDNEKYESYSAVLDAHRTKLGVSQLSVKKR